MPEPPPCSYGVAPLDAFVAEGLAEIVDVREAASVPDPPLVFGDTRLGSLGDVQPDPAVRILFHGATVHGPEGVVSLGARVVAETLHHVWPPRAGATLTDGRWAFPAETVLPLLAEAEHLLAGDSGNYYHWLLDGIVRWRPDAAPCLVPWSGASFQRSGLAVLPGLDRGVVVEPDQAVPVERLFWTTSLTASGAAYHPAVPLVGRTLRRREFAPLDLYVSRADAVQRPLRNEAEIAAMCAGRGFQVARLAGLAVADQIGLFAAARRIVAPHGAGLANLVGARPGAALLELYGGGPPNWCFRRLAATMGVRYGCLIGAAEGDGWVLEPELVRAVLDDPAFQET